MARVSVPSASEVAERWSQGASGAGSRFAQNAADSADEWHSNASSDAAQSNYESAMQDPEVLSRRQSNIDDRSRSKYSQNLNAYGSQRYSQGVQAAQDDFQSAIGDVLSAIDGLQIPERGRPMSQSNQDRAREVQRALHEAGQSV